MEKAGKTVGSSKIAKETFAALHSRYKFVIEGIEEILPKVARLNGNDIHHVLQEHHAWQKLVKDPKDWEAVARIISKVLREGIEKPTHNSDIFDKVLSIGREEVLVRFRKYPDLTIKVSNSWVIK